MAMKIGFVGLGIMGRPMALNLLRGGHQVTVWARRAESMQPLLDAGASAAASPAGVAGGVDVLISIVADAPDVEQVMLGEQGVASAGRAGLVAVDMSTIRPAAARDIGARLGQQGIDFLDAPVSGGEVGAKAASLTIMVGAPGELVFARVLPLLQHMGRNITHVGGVGDGQTTKVANQIIVALNIAAVSEALVFAAKAGADPAKVRQALMGGFASSRILEVHGERMIQRTFAPGFRIRLHQKDLALALQGARELGMALPQTAGAAQLMQAVAAHGGADLDHSALVKALELMAGHEVAPG